MATHRMERVNSEIQKALADIITNKLRDPEIDDLIVSVTKVETAPDLSYCKAYVSVFGDEFTKNQAMAVLNNSKSFIRRELAHTVRLRIVPSIDFCLDESYEKGQKIMQLIDKVIGDNDEK